MTLEANQKSRLIVLLPESLVGDLGFAQKIHRMASRTGNDVLYLTLLEDPDEGLSVSRGIATMKAVTESDQIKAGSVQIPTSRWFAKLQQICRPGDTIVCHREQTVNLGSFKTEPTADYLTHHFTNPIVALDGFYHPQQMVFKSWMRGLVFWLGALVIVAGFTLLELQADLAFPGFAHKLVLAAILLIEFGAIWFWSQIIRR